jgi:uncharacterized membrane protein YkvA (DUF1232 family)
MANFTESLKRKVKALKQECYALYLAYKHPGVPWYAKLLIAVTLAYWLSPIDLIPDFIPILGYLDDLIIVPLLIMLSIKLVPEAIMATCRKRAIENPLPLKGKWIVAAIIIMIWIAMAIVLVAWLWPELFGNVHP